MPSTSNYNSFLGKKIHIIIERAIGSRHPEHGHIYPCNYGYLPDTLAKDGEPIDVYLLGVYEPVDEFTGVCIAIIERKDDNENKLVVVSEGVLFTAGQIAALIGFQERFFDSRVVMLPGLEDRQQFPVTVHIVFIEGDRVFLLRRANTGYEDGNYSLVAGHLDGDETVIQAAVRESLEEAGVKIRPDDLEIKFVLHRQSEEERFDFILLAYAWKGELHNAEETKCDQVGWFPLTRLPENTVPYIRYVLENFKEPGFYKRFGWERL
jgi:inorganic pyrophosphatase